MKILSLNTWGGRIRPQIYDFLSQQAKTVDVFCLQEVYYDPSGKSIKDFSDKIPHDINMLDTLREILPDYDIFFASLIHEIYGIVMCSRKGTHPLMYQEYQVGGPDIWIPLEDRTGDHARKIQILTLSGISIVNFHGIWTPLNSKRDCPERDMQTDKILSIIDNFDTPSILIGDYNLRHDTNSFARLSKGRQDLIKESGVTSTRTSFYEKTEYLFADYALVDNGITVTSFQVLDDEVSDHKAMILEIETR